MVGPSILLAAVFAVEGACAVSLRHALEFQGQQLISSSNDENNAWNTTRVRGFENSSCTISENGTDDTQYTGNGTENCTVHSTSACQIKNIIAQVDEILGNNGEAASDASTPLQSLAKFADQILCDFSTAACTGASVTTCGSSSALSIASGCSMGSYFSQDVLAADIGLTEEDIKNIKDLEVQEIKDKCGDNDELEAKLEAALEKYKAWEGMKKITYKGGAKSMWIPKNIDSSLGDISMRPLPRLQRENIEVKPLMHAFEWATEPDWVCAPARNTTDGKYTFSSAIGMDTGFGKAFDALEVHAVQNEKCAVCENFVMKLFTSKLIEEATEHPDLQEKVNVIGLIDCDALHTIRYTPSLYKTPLTFEWIKPKETCEHIRFKLAKMMSPEQIIKLNVLATDIRNNEFKNSASNEYRCFHTCTEYLSNHFCGNLNCCDPMKTLGCPKAGDMCDQCLNAVMAWGTDPEYLSKTASKRSNEWTSYGESYRRTYLASQKTIADIHKSAYEDRWKHINILRDQKLLLREISHNLNAANINMDSFEAAAKMGIVMNMINAPDVCQSIRKNLNLLITEKGRKTNPSCHEPKKVGIKFPANVIFTSCLKEYVRAQGISDETQLCSQTDIMEANRLSANMIHGDDHENALSGKLVDLICKEVVLRWSLRKRGNSICECVKLSQVFNEYTCNSFLDDYISEPILSITTPLDDAILKDAKQKSSTALYWQGAPCPLGEDMGGLQMKTRESLQDHIATQMQILDNELLAAREEIDTAGYMAMYHENLYKRGKDSYLLSEAFWLKYIHKNMPTFARQQYGITCQMDRKMTGPTRCFKCKKTIKIQCQGDEPPWFACGTHGEHYGGKLYWAKPKKEKKNWNPWALALRICSVHMGICANKGDGFPKAHWYRVQQAGKYPEPFVPSCTNKDIRLERAKVNSERNIPAFYDDSLDVDYPIELTPS